MGKPRSNTPVLVIAGLLAGSLGAWFYWRSVNLSRNFKVKDLSKSVTAKRLGIKEQLHPPSWAVKNARVLAKDTLQPIRDTLQAPIFIGSWWRHELTNYAVGGVPTSIHLKAQAVDMRTVIDGQFRNDLLAKAVLNSGVPFTKMILEYGTIKRPLLIHLSHIPNDNRRLIYRKTESGYMPLLAEDIYSL